MLTALDAPTKKLDAHERKFVSIVREHGWHRMNVFADDDGPGFSYTTGFWVGLGHPELIVFSLNSELAGEVLWDMYRNIKAGHRYPVAQSIPDLFANCAAFLRPVAKAHYAAYLGWSRWFYGGDDFPCLQLVWPDPDGRFPWQAATSAGGANIQPDLSADGWDAMAAST